MRRSERSRTASRTSTARSSPSDRSAPNCALYRQARTLAHPGFSLSEQRLSASLSRATAEDLLLELDTPEGRAFLGLTAEAPACDGLFFVSDRFLLAFVELKGSDVARACEQLRSAMLALRQRMREGLPAPTRHTRRVDIRDVP